MTLCWQQAFLRLVCGVFFMLSSRRSLSCGLNATARLGAGPRLGRTRSPFRIGRMLTRPSALQLLQLVLGSRSAAAAFEHAWLSFATAFHFWQATSLGPCSLRLAREPSASQWRDAGHSPAR